ncbi:hypothetical protein [Croceicoccus gelatinilyticus]|uniref:hypothetical protein n=1 Tax=Croceicoccus gelatinilyticus TaxID=2835536 RepID=UPI001BCC8334|nr:hypothetical protein [Croceicoccus gelatinilyticus]MBS7671782.1 hypothetical protein [Croceicoccus gelatinilyticus]
MIISSKSANAFFEHAEANGEMIEALGEVGGSLGASGTDGAISSSLDRTKSRLGGLWVGGTIQLTTTHLMFRPNEANAQFHANAATLEFAHELDTIRRVEHQGGFLTGIIEVESDAGIDRFRCFGAKKFIDGINEARRQR